MWGIIFIMSSVLVYYPIGKTKSESGVGSMLGQRLRRWPSIDPAPDACLATAGMSIEY